LKKLLNSPYCSQLKDDQLQKFAEILSNPKQLQDTYLSTDFAQVYKIKSNLKNEKDEVTNTEEEELEIKEAEENKEYFEKNIKIRIVVVDQDAKSSAKQSLKHFLSPVLSKMDIIPQLGMFHSALGINF
jgi:hypothetical protein